MEFRDWLVLGICITSILLITTALVNFWQIFAYLMAINLSLWLILGASNSRKREAIFVGVSALMIWIICISLIFYYWGLFYKRVPDFWIAGMHPGFFVMFPLMWLLIFIPTTLGYALLFNRLNKSALEEFKKKIGKTEEVKI
ncbi:MAG: hypothetical protein RMH75_04935 [Archaeoglobaceae archaeon]|nr:hypothetical protein [Archaeoglobaceae archaeon]MDW7989990.1 hypothetical protein [Archaeoglobaceae archaeon]